MFCPQCGNQSPDDLKFCRSCGANLKVIGKAVSLSEAIARSDGLPMKIKASLSNIKISQVTEEVSRAMDKMNKEIARTSAEHRRNRRARRQKSAEERRERQFTKGVIKLFWGTGVTVFLYFLAHSLVLKLPADVIARTPFEIESVVRVIWLIGLLPMLSGVGHILAGLMIKRSAPAEIEGAAPLRIDGEATPLPSVADAQVSVDDEVTVVGRHGPPASVTDRTTNILDREPRPTA